MRDSGLETKRLAALRRYRLIDSAPDPLVDRFVALVSAWCETPVAILGCIDRNRVRVKSAIGVDAREFDRDDALWSSWPADNPVDVVPDLPAEARLSQHPELAPKPFRFVARTRILSDDGELLAILALLDPRPRRLTDLQRAALDVAGPQLGALFELHRLQPASRRPAPADQPPAAKTVGEPDRRQAEPASTSEADDASSAAPAPIGDALVKRRILVVDDVEAAATMLGRVLEAMGHETRIAHDGPRALAIAKEYRPDVVLLDLGMPGMSGYVVARLLRAQTGLEGMTLIAVTGHGRDEDRRQALEAGFDHHLLKPVDPAHMRALLDSLGPGPK
jgi:CheY-like chemotaxis protein